MEYQIEILYISKQDKEYGQYDTIIKISVVPVDQSHWAKESSIVWGPTPLTIFRIKIIFNMINSTKLYVIILKY